MTRPVTDRLELLFLTLLAELWQTPSLDAAKNKVFLNARAPQIREALRRVAKSTRNELQEKSSGHVQFLVRFLLDFPGPHEGTLVGLADKAIRWHQHQRAEERAKVRGRYGAQTRVSTPSIPVPIDPAIRRLETVEEIVQEGELMEHCVASYVPHLLDGSYYLFHVEYDGDIATAMVDHSGKVVEARGPQNRRNLTCKFGETALAKWGHRLKSTGIERTGSRCGQRTVILGRSPTEEAVRSNLANELEGGYERYGKRKTLDAAGLAKLPTRAPALLRAPKRRHRRRRELRDKLMLEQQVRNLKFELVRLEVRYQGLKERGGSDDYLERVFVRNDLD